MALGCVIVLRAPPAQAQSQFSLTLTNPTPVAYDYFGNSVATVGSDKVLVGASMDDTGVGNAGAAYLFSTNGTLLTTFPIPLLRPTTILATRWRGWGTIGC